jgi:hypothetical protein
MTPSHARISFAHRAGAGHPALLALCLLIACASTTVRAEAAADLLAPNPHLQLQGVPPIPASLARSLEPYTRFTPRTAVSWHPVRRELIVARRAGNTTQLNTLTRPGGPLVPITRGADPVRAGFWLAGRPDVLVFARDTGGNEQGQLYRLDPGSAEPVLLTDAAKRHHIAALNHARNRILVASTTVDRNGRTESPTTELALLDPLHPETARHIASLPGTG